MITNNVIPLEIIRTVRNIAYFEEFTIKKLEESLTTSDLDLSDSFIEDEDIESYIVPFLKIATQVTKLNLYDNKISSVGAKALSKAMDHITELDISFNNIGNVGAKALSWCSSLKVLNISKNGITGIGIKALAANTNLEWLELGWCTLSKCGIEALANNSTLTFLSIQYGDPEFSVLNLDYGQVPPEIIEDICNRRMREYEKQRNTFLMCISFKHKESAILNAYKKIRCVEPVLKEILSYVKPKPLKFQRGLETVSLSV